MKEYNLKEYSKSDLPVKTNAFGNLKRFFTFELSQKQEKVLTDVKSFWTNELDFSEFKEFWHKEMKLPKLNFFSKKDINQVPNDNNEL